MVGDEKPMVKNGEAEAKPNEEGDEKRVRLNEAEAEADADADADADAAPSRPRPKPMPKGPAPAPEPLCEPHHTHKQPPPSEPQQQPLHLKERNIDLQLDLEKANPAALPNDPLHHPKQLPPKSTKDEPFSDKTPLSSSLPLPMSVAAGWHAGLAPMGYVAPLQGVVSMDGSAMASPPIQAPHFVFSQPKPKRCATHCYIARSVSMHQQVVKMNPYWPAAAGTAPLFGAKPYNLNLVPPPPDLHAAAAAAAGRGGLPNSAQDKAQPFALFPAQPASKDKSPLTTNAPDANAQKKQQQQQQQFLLPQSLPPGAPSNMLHAPAFFFPFGQQQAAAAAAAAASARPSSTKSPSTTGSGASTTTTSTSAPMGTSAAMAPGPAMSFSYPNMGGNETQFMAILGNGPYPFPVPANVGAAPPYRGSHPQAMSFFNGSFYSSQMLHPSQLQQQQSPAPQSMQMQQQNHQNPSISTASSSSQKHLQNQQQQRPQGGGATGAGASNPSWQNFPAAKGGRPSQPHHDVGGEDSPSTADSRTRPNLSVYGQSFAMPFHSANFAMVTPPSSVGGSGGNASGAPNSNHGDKKQQQQSQQQALKAGIEGLTPAFPMSFATMNGATTQGLDLSSMANSHAILQSLPEAARQNYQMMAVQAAQAAQAAHQKKNNYRGSEDGKTGGGGSTADASNMEEERKAMASRASAASGGQSIAFSRDLAETSISNVPGGGNVVDSSARSLNLIPGSTRPSRSSGPNSNASNSQPQQPQMLFSKQQQFVAATVAAARSKTPATSNGSVYPDHLSSSVIAAKFPNSLPSFPPLVQSGGSSVQSPQWKSSSVRPTTSQVTSPSLPATTSTAANNKNHQQQQGRPQQNHTQISFGVAANNNPKPPSSQGQQTPNNNQAASPPMMVGSPSTSSISKGAGGSPRHATSASTGHKAGAQGSSLSAQQGRNSPSPSLSSQKPSILGSPHIIQSSSGGSKSQLHEPHQQPQLSKQSIQQAQLFFSSAYMQASANTSPAGSGYYLQRHRPDNQQQQGQKSQGSGTPTSSSGMLSSGGNAGTSDPAKAVAAAAAAANSMKGLPSQGIFHAAQFAQSAGGTHQLVPPGFPYVHAVPAAVQVKPAEQKQPAGE